jgi:hypothetical protein
MCGIRLHTDHQSRLEWLRRQIQREPKTNLTIADFCRQLGVSVPTFYDRKRSRTILESSAMTPDSTRLTLGASTQSGPARGQGRRVVLDRPRGPEGTGVASSAPSLVTGSPSTVAARAADATVCGPPPGRLTTMSGTAGRQPEELAAGQPRQYALP